MINASACQTAQIEIAARPLAPPPTYPDDQLERWREEERLREEDERLPWEQARIEEQAAREQSRRDAERREAFQKHNQLREQRIAEGRDRDRRAASAKANYEALRQQRRDCARTTKNGSYQVYGCEGINDRVREAETKMRNARNRRW